MRRLIMLSSLIFSIVLVSTACTIHSTQNIQAEKIDIGLGSTIYTSPPLDQETLQFLVDTYNSLQSIGETEETINDAQAITITFIHEDKIVGNLVIDEEGRFIQSTSEHIQTLAPNDSTYEQLAAIYYRIHSSH